MKKMALIIMAVCLITCMGIAAAQADWYTCQVIRTGTAGANTYIMLTDSSAAQAFTQRWFTIDPTYAKQNLATALTAISTGMLVRANFSVAGVPTAYATVTALYITSN